MPVFFPLPVICTIYTTTCVVMVIISLMCEYASCSWLMSLSLSFFFSLPTTLLIWFQCMFWCFWRNSKITFWNFIEWICHGLGSRSAYKSLRLQIYHVRMSKPCLEFVLEIISEQQIIILRIFFCCIFLFTNGHCVFLRSGMRRHNIYHGHITKTLKVLTAYWLVAWYESDTFTVPYTTNNTLDIYGKTSKSFPSFDRRRAMKKRRRKTKLGKSGEYLEKEELCKLNYAPRFVIILLKIDPRQ